jgi:lysophospholipase L1-like esterase
MLVLELVDWARAVQRDGSLMSADEVHASPAGYRARARMYAKAIRACARRRAGSPQLTVTTPQ